MMDTLAATDPLRIDIFSPTYRIKETYDDQTIDSA